MTFPEYYDSREWSKLDLFNGTRRRGTRFTDRYAIYQAWSAKYAPEMGDALLEAVYPRKHYRDGTATAIRSFVERLKKRARTADGIMAECRDCGRVWKPDDHLHVRRCVACGKDWIRLLFEKV